MNGQRLTEQLQLALTPVEEDVSSSVGRESPSPPQEVHVPPSDPRMARLTRFRISGTL